MWLGIDLTSDYGGWGVGEENSRPRGPQENSLEALLVPVLLCSAFSLCMHHTVSTTIPRTFLHCSSVSQPSFNYFQQPSWIPEDVLGVEAQSSVTAVTSEM